MKDGMPLGEKEDLRKEFKGADALKEPEKIAREVVAMLNAEGGRVWVGIREDKGFAVEVEPIGDPETEKRKLLDFLVDTIEPPISSSEVVIGIWEEGGRPVLRVEVDPNEANRPYSFLRKTGRYFVIRVGDRIRPMTREELFRRPVGLDRAERLGQAERKVMEDRKAVLAGGRELFWMRLEPAATLSLDIQDRRIKEYLQDPQATGNRSSGWNFSKFNYGPRIRQGTLVTSPDEFLKVEIRSDGGLVFSAPLEALHWKGEENQIWPPVLIEYIVSALRVARAIYQDHLQEGDSVVVDLVLAGLQGWILRPGAPGIWFSANRPRKFSEDDFALIRPFVFRFKELASDSGPDRCGYRLIERVYEAFGIRREDIPKLFDPDSGRLIMPE